MDGALDQDDTDVLGVRGQRARLFVHLVQHLPLGVQRLHVDLYVCDYLDSGSHEDFQQVDWKAFGRELSRLVTLKLVTITLIGTTSESSKTIWNRALYGMVAKGVSDYILTVGEYS